MSVAPGGAPQFALSPMSPEQAMRIFLDRLTGPGRLLVALSGGGDSVGLLVALKEAASARPDLRLHAATVDHALRLDSAEEAHAAARLCARIGVDHKVLTWRGDKPETAIQATARTMRYRLLVDEAMRVGAEIVVAGHTIDDQRETLAMRRRRDPGAQQGMDAAVLLQRRVWLLRPLLGVTREALREFLRVRQLAWSDDPSNRNVAFERVSIRLSGAAIDSDPVGPDGVRDVHVEAAAFVCRHVVVHAGQVGLIDLKAFDTALSSHRIALLTLAAVLGGRVHSLGRESADKVFDALASGIDFRLAAGRLVFDRRKDTLYLTREARGLPDVSVQPGQTVDWDGRFEIVNRSGTLLRIAAGPQMLGRIPLLPPPATAWLPNGVARRVALQMPRIVSGDTGRIEIRKRLAPFEDFLPRRKLELADSIALAFDQKPFPKLSIVNGSF